MQAVIEWAEMDGYGAYVWSVFALLVLVIIYEVGRLKLAQRRSQRIFNSLNNNNNHLNHHKSEFDL